MNASLLEKIADGRTDLVFEYLAAGIPAHSAEHNAVSLIQWCAYYGDVSAIRMLLANGESLNSLGPNLDLNGAAFHGHWRLCQFLIGKRRGRQSSVAGYRRDPVARGVVQSREPTPPPRG